MSLTESPRAAQDAASRLPGPQRWWAVVLLLIGVGVCLRPIVLADAQSRLLRQAAKAAAEWRQDDAERLARAVLEQWPDCATALVIAGEAAAKGDRSAEALAYFDRVSPENPAEYVRAQYGAGARLLSDGLATAAERHLRRALELDPQHAKANEKLAALLSTEGRTWEALPFVETLIRSGQCGRDELLMAGAIDSMMIDNPPFIEKCLRVVPDDPVVLLGRGRLALLRRDDAAQAESIFRRIIECDPQQIEALARLGEVLLERPDPSLFLRWNAALPKIAESHPRTWYARGMWAKRNGQPRAAVRCFLEALRLHPNHPSSNFQLSQVLISLGLPEEAEPFVERARLLSKLDFTLSQLQNLPDLELMRQVSEIHEQLGCWWESMGWCQAAVLLAPDTAWAQEKLARPNRLGPASDDFTMGSAQPALTFDLSAYPLPVWPETDTSAGGSESRGPVDGDVRLVDVAAEAGLVFQYYNGTTAAYGPDHIISAPGGGVGVVDYDADGWPDLYFPQAGLWEKRGAQNPHRDRLFRNLGNGRFADVTDEARLGDAEFSAGVAVGDYNGDGFPDLYVANIGPNRLYENMGDGTFREVTGAAGVGGDKDQWCTSAAIVDLNADGLPEIYAVHYVLLKEALARDCGKGNQPMGCAPTLFHAEQDRLYQNLGDGRFRDVTGECGIRVPDGKGLAIVAADFDGSGRTNVYVANDTTPNFYFVNRTEGPGKPLAFVEKGLESGVALNENGQCMASMGVALADADGDGLVDLYIGTFYHDSNTLLRQNPDHTFIDESRRANLRAPTFNMLTFGTQFIDGELDGWPDLIQANGHVDPSYDPDVPDRMPPQYIKNLGGGKFVELTGRSLGPYFEKKCLGRSVAVLDWDRDGKEDAAVSHLDVPAALLANRTRRTGHFLAVQLVGRTSNRDAFGATIELSAGGRTWTRPLAAGSGYMASNERKAIFGLGQAERVERLDIRWPSGARQTFENVGVDQELLVVEGEPAPLRLPK